MTSTKLSRNGSSFAHYLGWSMGYNKLLTAVYAVIAMLIFPAFVITSLMASISYYTDPSNYTGDVDALMQEGLQTFGESVYNSAVTSVLIPLTMFVVIILCASHFNYVMYRRSVDLYHALPIRRTSMLMGGYLAVFLKIAMPLTLSSIICNAILIAYGVPVAVSITIWLDYLYLILSVLASAAFTMFFFIASGTMPNAYFSAVTVAVGYPMTVLIIDTTMSLFLPGYVTAIPALGYWILCPYVIAYLAIPNFSDLLILSDSSYEMSVSSATTLNLPVIICLAVLTAAFIFFSIKCYKHRKSENSESSYICTPVHIIIRSLMTIGGALSIANIIGTMFDSNKAYLIGLIVGALFAHIIYHIIIARTLRRIWVTIPAFIITAGLICGFLYILMQGGFGYVTRVPNADDVQNVQVSLPSVAGDDSKESYLATNANYLSLMDKDGTYLYGVMPEFTDKSEIETVEKLQNVVINTYSTPYLPFDKEPVYNADCVNIIYTLANGQIISRNYCELYVSSDETELLKAIADVQKTDTLQKYALYCFDTAENLTSIYCDDTRSSDESYYGSFENFTDEQRQMVWSTFEKELNSSTFSASNGLKTRAEYEQIYQEQLDSENWTDEDSYINYGIECLPVRLDALDEDFRNQILEQAKQEGISDDGLQKIAEVDGNSSSFVVPECCTETIALIQSLIDNNGGMEASYDTQIAQEEETTEVTETDPADASTIAVTPADSSVSSILN